MNRSRSKFILVVLCAWLTVGSFASAQSRIDMVQQRIVKIFGAGGIRNLNAYSSGFIVDSRGYAITVWNHVLDTSELSVVLHNGRKYAAEGSQLSLRWIWQY